jgi:hypothetical protein
MPFLSLFAISVSPENGQNVRVNCAKRESLSSAATHFALVFAVGFVLESVGDQCCP